MLLLTDAERKRFFLVPDPSVLGTGKLLLKSMTKQEVRVDAAAAARYEVPEPVAKAWAEEHTVGLRDVVSKAREELDKIVAQAQTAVGALANRAGIVESLGIDQNSPPEEILAQLTQLARRLSVEIPEGIGDVEAARKSMANADAVLAGAGKPGSGTVAVLGTLAADPASSPELKQAAAKLEEFARKLTDDS